MGVISFLIQCLNAVQYGLLLFLVASGLTLIFGAMGIINLAHGSFYMIGAYFAYGLASWVGRHLQGGFFIAVAAGLLVSIALGYVLERAFFSLLYKRAHLQQVLMTYALVLIFEELRSILAGDDVHGVAAPPWLSGSVPLGGLMTYPVYRFFLSIVCLLVALGLYLLLSRTRLGMQIRAAASDRAMAESLGVNVARLYRAVFAGGVALSVVAGMLAAPITSVYPGMGGEVLITCFVVVVIGGIGSVRGAFGAALLVGAVDTFGKVFFQEAAGVLVYVMMAAVLVWRPEGLVRRA